jgi:serine/threonine protein kinase
MSDSFGFELKQRIGMGAMATVHYGIQKSLQRPVVLKFMHEHLVESQELVQRFEREARAYALLRHPHVVQVIDHGLYEGRPFIALEFLDGWTLKDILARGPLSPEAALLLFRDLLLGLGYAHHAGVIHRDIKPANLMVTHEGVLKVMDFGLARIGEDATLMTHAGDVLGSPAYMSPEQANGEPVDSRTDIFSSGIVGYEMTTGVRPFEGKTYSAILHSIVSTEPRPVLEVNPALPPRLAPILDRMLAKRVADRYPDVTEPRDAIEDVIGPVLVVRGQEYLRRYLADPAGHANHLRDVLAPRIVARDPRTPPADPRPNEPDVAATLPSPPPAPPRTVAPAPLADPPRHGTAPDRPEPAVPKPSPEPGSVGSFAAAPDPAMTIVLPRGETNGKRERPRPPAWVWMVTAAALVIVSAGLFLGRRGGTRDLHPAGTDPLQAPAVTTSQPASGTVAPIPDSTPSRAPVQPATTVSAPVHQGSGSNAAPAGVTHPAGSSLSQVRAPDTSPHVGSSAGSSSNPVPSDTSPSLPASAQPPPSPSTPTSSSGEASIVVSAKPYATIYLNDRLVRSNWAGDLVLPVSAGPSYVVRAEYPGQPAKIWSVTLQSGESRSLVHDFLETTGSVFVGASGGFGEIVMDGAPTGIMTPNTLKHVPQGTHTITVQRKGFNVDGSRTVVVVSGQTVECQFVLTKKSSY